LHLLRQGVPDNMTADNWPPDGTPYRPAKWRRHAPAPGHDIGPPTIHQGLQAVYRAGRRFELIADFEYESAIAGVGRFTCPKGMITDFHSVPRALWPIFPHDDWAESAVAHDWLYRRGGVTRKQADQTHREVLRFLGASAARAQAMYTGLRAWSWRAWNDYRNGKPWPT
jgi:hypothetical protein